MGGVNEGSFGPSIEEMVEDITTLLPAFDPTSNERYTKVERRVHYHIPLFRKGILTDTYPVAWGHNIYVRKEGDGPLAVRLYATLKPSVWVTSDLRFIQQDPVIEDWLVATIEEIPASRYKSLQLGLQGDFETIDRKFEAACREYAANAVDEAIKEINSHSGNSLAAILLPPTVDTTASDFAWRREQCIETLLRNQSSSV